ncbi:hypothetical protein [Streptomyces sp. NPDC058373]|uniref:hypothetical protein n=1 Tax=Streptomyces sp. NPDC058373 TaxID=3346465 RepID=UPI00364ACD9C
MNPGDGQGYDTDERYGGAGQTRTRLPGDDEAYDTTRRSMRPSRSLITVVGVVVLLIAAIAFANQGGSPDTPSDARGPAPSETAPTGTRPVDTTTSGIPTNHPRTKQGAESAAANYAVALGSAEMFNEARRSEILEAVIVPSEVQRFRESLDKAYSKSFLQNLGLKEDGTSPEGFTFVSRTTPIGTADTKYADSTATVSVWCSGLLGMAGETSTNPVTNSWFTITMELRWVDGDWKIFNHSQKEGPAPVPSDERAATSEEIAKAVEGYGGLTYAR